MAYDNNSNRLYGPYSVSRSPSLSSSDSDSDDSSSSGDSSDSSSSDHSRRQLQFGPRTASPVLKAEDERLVAIARSNNVVFDNVVSIPCRRVREQAVQVALSTCAENLESKVNSLENRLDAVITSKNKTEQGLEEASAKLSEMKAKHQELMNQVDASKQENEKLSQERAAFKASYDEKCSEYEKLKTQFEVQQERIRVGEEDRQTLDRNTHESAEEQLRILEQIEQSKKLNDEVLKQKKQFDDEKKELIVQQEKKDEECKQLEEELDQEFLKMENELLEIRGIRKTLQDKMDAKFKELVDLVQPPIDSDDESQSTPESQRSLIMDVGSPQSSVASSVSAVVADQELEIAAADLNRLQNPVMSFQAVFETARTLKIPERWVCLGYPVQQGDDGTPVEVNSIKDISDPEDYDIQEVDSINRYCRHQSSSSAFKNQTMVDILNHATAFEYVMKLSEVQSWVMQGHECVMEKLRILAKNDQDLKELSKPEQQQLKEWKAQRKKLNHPVGFDPLAWLRFVACELQSHPDDRLVQLTALWTDFSLQMMLSKNGRNNLQPGLTAFDWRKIKQEPLVSTQGSSRSASLKRKPIAKAGKRKPAEIPREPRKKAKH